MASATYNCDGNLDIFKTHFADDTNISTINDGKGNFTDATFDGAGRGDALHRLGRRIVDLDNDGTSGLVLVTGSVYPEVEEKVPGYPYKTPRVIFRNLGQGTVLRS